MEESCWSMGIEWPFNGRYTLEVQAIGCYGKQAMCKAAAVFKTPYVGRLLYGGILSIWGMITIYENSIELTTLTSYKWRTEDFATYLCWWLKKKESYWLGDSVHQAITGRFTTRPVFHEISLAGGNIWKLQKKLHYPPVNPLKKDRSMYPIQSQLKPKGGSTSFTFQGSYWMYIM